MGLWCCVVRPAQVWKPHYWPAKSSDHKKSLERQVEHMEQFRTNSQVLPDIKQFGNWILTMVDVGVLSLRVFFREWLEFFETSSIIAIPFQLLQKSQVPKGPPAWRTNDKTRVSIGGYWISNYNRKGWDQYSMPRSFPWFSQFRPAVFVGHIILTHFKKLLHITCLLIVNRSYPLHNLGKYSIYIYPSIYHIPIGYVFFPTTWALLNS